MARWMLVLWIAACGGSDPTSGGLIGPGGGTVVLPGVAEVEFPPGAFEAPTEVRIETTNDPIAAEVYAETTTIFEVGPRASYDVSIVTGGVAPVGTVRVKLFVPRELGPALFANAFVDVRTASELDSYETFELIDTDERDLDALTVPIDGTRFAVLRRDVHEAVLAIAGSKVIDELPRTQTRDAAGCVAKMLSPLNSLAVRSAFNPSRVVTVNGVDHTGHFGTDYVAADGDDLFAVGEGKVLDSYVSKSFGETIVLSMPGLGAVRYAHMRTGSRLVQAGDTVCEGEKIGQSDNTGLSTGAHLHFEYAPSGSSSNSAKIDPTPCIDTQKKPSTLGGTWAGRATMTSEIPFTGSNIGVEQTVETTSAVLLPMETETTPGKKQKICNTLVPRSGHVQLVRTETYMSGGQVCTIAITGTMQLTHQKAGPSSLSSVPLPDGSVTYTAAMGDVMQTTHVDACAGTTTQAPTQLQWLHIPLDLNDPAGPRITDPDHLFGMIEPMIPGVTMRVTWDFTR